MKTMVLLAMLILTLGQGVGDITGEWTGVLNVDGTRLRLVFHIEKSDAGYSATVDSLDQGAKGIPVATTTFVHPDLKLELPNIGAVYEGKLSEQSIEGTWKQGTRSMPLTMSRKAEGREQKIRSSGVPLRGEDTLSWSPCPVSQHSHAD
jgi:hypothetical protein